MTIVQNAGINSTTTTKFPAYIFKTGIMHIMYTSAGSILDISKYRDTCERSISILDGIAILRYIEYRMIRRYLDDISYDPRYRPIRYLNNRRYGSIARKPRYRDTYYW